MSFTDIEPQPSPVNLLKVDPDLAVALSEPEQIAAQRVTLAPAVGLTKGDVVVKDMLKALPAVDGEILGFQVVSGLLGAEVMFAGRVSRRLLGPSDLILFDGLEDSSLPAQAVWTAMETATLALIDERLLMVCQRWPKLLIGMFKRSAGHMRALALQQAVSQLPRVEDRLLAMLWILADQYGTSGRDGIRLSIALKHTDIAMMIGAARPTVSLAFTQLIDRGDVSVDRDGWLLTRRSLDTFAPPEA